VDEKSHKYSQKNGASKSHASSQSPPRRPSSSNDGKDGEESQGLLNKDKVDAKITPANEEVVAPPPPSHPIVPELSEAAKAPTLEAEQALKSEPASPPKAPPVVDVKLDPVPGPSSMPVDEIQPPLGSVEPAKEGDNPDSASKPKPKAIAMVKRPNMGKTEMFEAFQELR